MSDTVASSTGAARFRWSEAGPLALIAMGAVALAFAPTTAQLVELWMDSDTPYSHGLLVGPIALWLIVRACLDVQPKAAARSISALVLFGGAVLLWTVGYAVDVLAVQEVLFPTLLLLGAASIGGWPVARRLFFPVGFLYFAIPIWTELTPLLQAVTVAVVGSVLNVFGIPLYVEGNFITIPEGVFEIADGCAGLHFFIVALTVASLRGYLSLDGLKPRLWLIAVAVGLALVTNWLRVGSLVAIGHATDMQHYFITHDHYYYGWALFALALIPLFLFARWQSNRGPQRPVVRSDAASRGAPRVGSTPRFVDFAMAAAFALLLVLPVAVVAGRSGDSDATPFDFELPDGVAGWQLVGAPDWAPVFAGADAQASDAYARADEDVGVYLAVYRSQSQGRELISNDNRLFAEGWRSRSVGAVAVGGIPGLERVQERVVVSPGGAERVIWSWYAVGSRMVAENTAAKLWQALDEIRGRDSGAVVALSMQCPDDCAAARLLLREFLEAMGEPLAAAAVAAQVAPAQ